MNDNDSNDDVAMVRRLATIPTMLIMLPIIALAKRAAVARTLQRRRCTSVSAIHAQIEASFVSQQGASGPGRVIVIVVVMIMVLAIAIAIATIMKVVAAIRAEVGAGVAVVLPIVTATE